VPASVAQAWQPPPPREKRLPSGLHGRLLLAEDVPDNQKLISHYLRKAGATVELAENGRVACEMVLAAAAQGHPFDAVLMDIQMPEVNGYAATTRLRKAGYARPVIALTAHAMPSDREKCLAAGCDDFLTKPISPEILIEKLRQYLGGGTAAPRITAPCDLELVTGEDVESMRAKEEMPAALFSTLGGDPEVLALLETFIERLPQRIAGMETSLARGDMTALASQAHQLKGTAGGYGFPLLSEAAARLEATVKGKGEPDEIAKHARCLIELCRRVQAAPRGPAPERAASEQNSRRQVGG
jgi:CheY-like chemotaxis protein/HPt (histidine-containing phosphotransfer) domain-containing protein